jgi:hypothetical protein
MSHSLSLRSTVLRSSGDRQNCLFLFSFTAFLLTQGNKCDCLQNCNDMNYALHSKNVIFWFRGNFIRWELAKSRIRYKREVIFSFTDALGKLKV